MFCHTFSQGWLEGIRGGNIEHGLIAGAVSVVGGGTVEKYGKGLGKAGEVAANAVISGTAAELGGGKFANGAITGAFEKLFNDFMHQDPPQKKGAILYLEVNEEGTSKVGANIAAVASAADGPLRIGDAIGALAVAGTALYDEFTRIYIIYILTNDQGQVYVGRASGFGSAQAVMDRRFGSHGRKAEGFGTLVIDKVGKGTTGRHATRGREQQLINFYGGIGSPKVANTIRGVSRFNPNGRYYHFMSNRQFGPLAPYTGAF